MRLTKAVFSKYKKLKNVNVRLEDITIIIGQNNSGKSTLLEGIKNAVAKNNGLADSRYFSKILNEDASVRIFFRIDKDDLNLILNLLNLEHKGTDKLLIRTEFFLECVYHYNAYKTKKINVFPPFRSSYNDDARLDALLEKLIWMLDDKVIFIKPDLEISPEPILSRRQSVLKRREYPLNFLFYSQTRQKRLFNKFNKDIGNLFENVRIKIVRNNDQIILKVIQAFHDKQLEFEINEMGDGFRKALSMIMRIYLSHYDIVIIDEPDSSMHSKLVKDTINYLKGLGKQAIISTHNEIFINEFEKENLRYIYSKSPVYSTVEESEKLDLGEMFSNLGIDINYKKSSLISSQLILLVEGKDDEKYIKQLLQKTKYDKELSQYRIDYVDTQGHAMPDINVVDRMNKTQIPVLLVRDRDENTKEYLKRHQNRLGLRIHFWKRREIENYFLSYNSIHRAITEKLIAKGNRDNTITLRQVKNKIKELAQSLVIKICLMNIYTRYKQIPLTKDRSRISDFIKNAGVGDDDDDQVIQSFYKEFFEGIIKDINEDKVKDEFAREKNRLRNEWKNQNKILETCPGKRLIWKIRDWVDHEYGIQIEPTDLYRHISTEEIDQDFHHFVEKIIENCNNDAGEYLRNYDLLGKEFVEFYINKRYFNDFYYLACPEFNSNLIYVDGTLIYVDGTLNHKDKTKRSHQSMITIYDWNELKTVDSISLGKKIKIINMVYDRKSGLLFATGEIRQKDSLIDSLLIIEVTTGRVHTKELLLDYKVGKEGALGSLVVNTFNEKSGIIYAASVYSHGGNKVLYMVSYSIKGTDVEWDIKELETGSYGPLSLCADINNQRVYALCNEYEGDIGLVPVIYVVDSLDGSKIDRIPISKQFGEVTPYAGHLITINKENGRLAIVIGNELYIFSLSTKVIRRVLRSKKYLFVSSSLTSGNFYTITEEEDLELSNPTYNCLHVIKPNFEDQQIARFGPEIEIINIKCSNGVICIHAKDREKENEYSFWLFKENKS
jgi:AAA15 family ATPase/GTPase